MIEIIWLIGHHKKRMFVQPYYYYDAIVALLVIYFTHSQLFFTHLKESVSRFHRQMFVLSIVLHLVTSVNKNRLHTLLFQPREVLPTAAKRFIVNVPWSCLVPHHYHNKRSAATWAKLVVNWLTDQN